MPDASTGIRNFVAHEADAIVAGIRRNPIQRRTSPRENSRLLAHGRSYSTETKWLIDSGDIVPAVRSVVVHVALVRVACAPGAFERDYVIRLGKIRRAGVQGRIQVVNIDKNSVGRYVMSVAGVIIRCIPRREISGEWIHPGARTDPKLIAVQPRAVCIGATRAKMIATYPIASKTARV